jgi:hypothetical protein
MGMFGAVGIISIVQREAFSAAFAGFCAFVGTGLAARGTGRIIARRAALHRAVIKLEADKADE